MNRKHNRKLFSALAAAAVLSLSGAAHGYSPPFPRLAGIETGGLANYNSPAYQSALEKLQVMILKYWPGLKPGGESMESIISTIKARDPEALVFLYTNSDEGYLSSGNPMAPLYQKVNAMHWWLKDGSSLVPSFYGNGGYTINNTPNTARDADGDDSIDFIAKWYFENYYRPNPAIAGFFMDNVFSRPRVNGDWDGGSEVLSDTSSQAAAALQAGYERWFHLTDALMPGRYELANAGSWAVPHATVPPGYVDLANGAVLEGLIGKPYSTEAWAGWAAMMHEYDAVMAVTSAPKLVIFNQWGNPTDYQSFRYGFASCLMNNGYYSFASYSAGYYGVVHFDEYNAKLGVPVGPPPTRPWQNGVWRRDFTNGIALVNPKGNGPRTVSLGGTFVHLKGSQDPAVNNGERVTRVTLQNRDGLILMRLSPLTAPSSPGSVTVGG
jgi:hypothetical protein